MDRLEVAGETLMLVIVTGSHALEPDRPRKHKHPRSWFSAQNGGDSRNHGL